MHSKSIALKWALGASIVATGMISSNEAQAGFGIKGGLGFTKAAAKGTMATGSNFAGDTSFELGNSFGLTFDLDLGPVGVIVDALYTKRVFGDNNSGVSTNSLLVPMQIKLTLLPLFYLSGGVYYASGMGDVTNLDGSGNKTGTSSYAAAGLNKTDFGAVLGVGSHLPLGAVALTVEARYSMGLKNVYVTNNSGAELKNNHADLLLGFIF